MRPSHPFDRGDTLNRRSNAERYDSHKIDARKQGMVRRACHAFAPGCCKVSLMTRRLAEVARQVGVSEATVSRVLNGRSGVSASTRAAVLTALDVMGYERPTQLRGERARLVGLVLPELQNPIFPALAEIM